MKSWFLWTCLTVVLIGVALLSSLKLQPIQPAVAQDNAASKPSAEKLLVEKPPVEPVYKVVSPLGESTVKTAAMAPRLETLAGKTVGMVWNRSFKSNVILPAIAEALKKQYPTIKIVPYSEMPMAPLPEPPGEPRKESEALQAAFKAKGCDAVIAGNGG